MPVIPPATSRIIVPLPALLVTVGLVAIVAVVRSDGAAGQDRTALAQLEAAGQTERLAEELAARHERQIRAGLLEDAARTARQLEELTQAQIEKCSRYWEQMDALQSGRIPKDRLNVNTMMQLTFACTWRPGTSAVDDTAVERHEERMWRLFSEREGAGREPLFIEPTLLAFAVDQDVLDAWEGSFWEAVEASPLLEQMYENGNRALATSPAEADKLWEQMLVILQQSPDTKPAAIARVLDLRRFYEEFWGTIPAALEYARAQTDLLERAFGADSVNLCPSLWNTASLLASSGQPERAIEAANRCLRIVTTRGPSSLTYASALNNLGVIAHRTGALDSAVDAYEKSRAAFEAAPRGTATIMALQATLSVHANLGLAHWQRGDVTQAYRHLQSARERMWREGATFITERGAVQGLAKLSMELDVFLTLERAATPAPAGTSLALPMLLERKSFGLGAKAATMRALSAEPERLREYRTLLAHRAALARAEPPNSEAQAERLKQAQEIDLQIQTLEIEAGELSSRAALLAAQRPIPRAAEYARALGDAIEKRMEEYYRRRPKTDRRTDEEILREIQRQAEAEIAPRFTDVFEAVAQELRGARESLLGDIQRKLTDTMALVEMVRFRPFRAAATTAAERWDPARYGAFVVLRTGTPAFIDYGEAATIDELIVEFRRTLSVPRGTLARDLGRRLDAALMQPVRAHLGPATQVYVSPDGLLNLLPFGALVDEQDRYLVETLTFNYLSSGRDLLREPAASTTRAGQAVVIADPAFDEASRTATAMAPQRSVLGNRFEPLPGTAAEAQAIRSLLPNTTVYTGERATETALKSVAAPRILHVATHGFFLEDQDFPRADSGAAAGLEDPMLRSGLVLAGANAGRSGNDDGVLTALEAGALGLSGTQLVVLSACETGVGDVKTGEGVFGLRRAFLAAGAETLVMSLWRVDDDATRQLMVEFYGRLAKGEGRAEALRQASLSLLRDPGRRHPFYWASFIATGEAARMRP